jgi:hypothetical protein
MDALTDGTSALDEADAIGCCTVSFQSRFCADGLP